MNMAEIYESRKAKAEDKQEICDLLCKALQATRGHYDLLQLAYEKAENGSETVSIIWEGGFQTVNVSMDSGTAMIRDIMKNID